MKANELMVGDWLLFYDEDESQNIPVKIVSIDDDGWVFYEFPDGTREEGWCKNLYFIPLTPEILEKNGFSRNGLDVALFDRKGGDDFVGAANLQYVHELQHAIRLCGIKKEIEL